MNLPMLVVLVINGLRLSRFNVAHNALCKKDIIFFDGPVNQHTAGFKRQSINQATMVEPSTISEEYEIVWRRPQIDLD